MFFILFLLFFYKKKYMILKKKYIEDEKIQKVWYDSSMILYSEMKEDENENKGDLTVTFKNGATYVYKDVSYEDYIILIGGGTDASQGKTLNKVIKNKYEYEKITDANIENIINELNEKEELNDIQNTYFISGHRDITENEFEYYYIPMINQVISENPQSKFIVGDCEGADIMSQNYLVSILDDINRITVYCTGNTPKHINTEIIYIKNGFETDRDKDIAMTKNSISDIAFVRNSEEMSGTAENILRRYKMFK